ncbi:TerD family protein [Fodinicola feengrottensis]|uniref:TerD family protein n=1 Tax=Fodinicola feengrottensis TaxID=435914 RepID=UPI00244340B0|nr:TerD family protein [Fodinicola feengrottensis]
MELTKGANTALPGAAVVITATASAALDIAALLVTATGKVRSDADFVFFNQPSAPGVTLQPPSTLRLDLGAVPAQIEKVVITATVDGTGTFASVQGLAATVTDAGGAPVAHFVPTGLASETALVLVEVYRRQGAWKVRAVGQGYATGLAGIATDFGISVEESPAPPPAYHPPARQRRASRQQRLMGNHRRRTVSHQVQRRTHLRQARPRTSSRPPPRRNSPRTRSGPSQPPVAGSTSTRAAFRCRKAKASRWSRRARRRWYGSGWVWAGPPDRAGPSTSTRR